MREMRRAVCLLLLGAMVVASPSIAADAGEANKAMARRVFDEILNRGRYEVFDEIYARDFRKHVDLRTFSLAEEIEDAKGTRAVADDLVLTIDHIVAEGDLVAIVYTGRGTNTGSFAGLPPSGRPFELTGATLYRFADGKIAEEWTFYNELEILRQLGQEGAARP